MNEAHEIAGAVALCPVCLMPSPDPFMKIGAQHYWKCGVCEARFLDPAQHPAPEEERRQYALHENDPDDPRYRNFLAKLVEPLAACLPEPSQGLDYGCGPGPALAEMMRERGHDMTLYDPFFFPGEEALSRSYDFIACTEVAEHFHHPAKEFDRLHDLLRPGGWLGIMTSFQTGDARFANWHYRKDPTHVVFYREETFQTIASRRGWSCHFPAPNVCLMRKASHSFGK
ncbi:MAG: methyltransferase type 12 [Alphaproteobacteria bacterium HGW-Alphaproteobacteria-3]|nr:MAG: methyltransferase type 12 [Alphaproteobacteria bacterium HGW-Alphaproteobacteria-3]